MDFNREVLLEKIRSNLLPLLLGAVGLILLGMGVISSLNLKPKEIVATSQEDIQSQKSSSRITVDIEGAVAKPGVYSLPPDSRIKDLLISAGGLSQDADRNWVSKNINLASSLADGVKVYITRIGENINSEVSNKTSGLVNINSASANELDALSGIGPVTAQKIIDNRPYKTIDDLVSKKILGQKTLDKIKEKITVF